MGLSREEEKEDKTYIPASSSAGYRASSCNFPSSGQALSLSDVCGDELQSAILDGGGGEGEEPEKGAALRVVG